MKKNSNTVHQAKIPNQLSFTPEVGNGAHIIGIINFQKQSRRRKKQKNKKEMKKKEKANKAIQSYYSNEAVLTGSLECSLETYVDDYVIICPQ